MTATTANQARFFRNAWTWNLKHDICDQMQVEKPASDAGKEAWTEFYAWFAEYLDNTIGAGAVKATLDYFSKVKKRATMATALQKAGLQAAKPAKPTTKPAPEAGDAKAILAEAFASGKITITEFTAAIAALDSSAKSVEVPVEVEPIDLDATGSDDLPF